MATNNPRIRYDIEAGVTGEQDVNALARELDKLAETLEGDLKTQAQASAQALRELGAKQGAIDNFVKLKTEAGEASKRLREAQAAAQDLGQAIAASGAPTRTQTAQMERLRDGVRSAKAELIETTSALDASRTALSAFGIASGNVAQSQRELTATGKSLSDQSKHIAKSADEARNLASASKTAADALGLAAGAADRKTEAIRSSLEVERSEISVLKAGLDLQRSQAQRALESARAKNDEAAETRALNQLRQVEASQLELTARSKRAEADAAVASAQARREQLAVVGPLTQAQQRELTVAENAAKALRTEADAAEEAARHTRTLVRDADASADALKRVAQATKEKSAAAKSALDLERSEISVARSSLELQRSQAQGILAAARAKGDEAGATRALNQLRQIEASQLELTARSKRAEAAAIQASADARRRQLAAVGPLSQAQQLELRASENAAKALRAEAAAADEAARSARRLGADLKDAASTANEQVGALTGRMAGAGQVARSMGAQIAAAFTVRELVQAAQDMEKLQAGLQAVSGSADTAKREMDFVRRVASQAGVDVVAAGEAYLGLAAATRGTAVEGEVTRQVFESVSTAMARAGKSSAETRNALVALQQMAGKGVVSMEELRGQLGEALPGALQAAANGMGITTRDLMSLVENGRVAAEDLFPALTKGLQDLYGTAAGAQTLSQELVNVKNAFVEMASYVGESGGNESIKSWAEKAQTAIIAVGTGLVDTGKKLGALGSAAASLDFSNVSAQFEEIEAAGREKLIAAAEHNEFLRWAIEKVGTEAERAALAARLQSAGVDQVGAAASSAAPSLAALGAAYAKNNEEAQRQVDLAQREVAVAKARGEAAIAHANTLSDEKVKREAIAKATADEATALAGLAQSRQTEVDILKAELAAREAVLAQGGEASDARKKEIDELKKLIDQKQLDADASKAQAAAAREKAKMHSVEVQAAKAAISAAQASTIVREADAKAALSGLQTQKELARQSEEMARLMGNETGIRQAKITQMEIEAKIIKAKADVSRIEAEGSIAVAKAKLAELTASGQLTPVKQAEIDATIKLAEAKIKEAEASGRSSELLTRQIELLRASGGASKGAGDAANEAADGFRNMGQAAGEAADHIERLQRTSAGRYGRPGEQSQQQGNESDYDPGRNMYGRAGQNDQPRNGLGETQGEWERRHKLAGQNAVDNTTMFALRDKLQAGLLTAADLPALQAVLAANAENDKIARAMGPGAWSLEGRSDWTQWQATMALFQQQVQLLGGAGTSKRVDMRIRTDRGDYAFDTDERGEKEIQRMLIDELQRSKKRSTRR